MDREKYYFQAPRLSQSDIWSKAEQFRERFAPSNIIPVDILHIVEFKLDIDLDPVDSLKSSLDVDAILLNSLDRIIVDRESFLNNKYLNRFRFSLAHEVGHLILHRQIIDRCRPKNREEWFEYMENRDEAEYSKIEQQAYEFAGRLLVPRDHLLSELQSIKPYVD